MDCCNEYGHCTGGHNCPARATPLVDASRKALAVLALTGADPALQYELVGAMAEPDRRVAELTAQRDELLAALNDALSVTQTVSRSRDRRVVRDGCVLYLQTEEWCKWAEDEVGQKLRATLAKHQPTAAPAANTP